jgi:hypothetical protein
MNAEHIPNEVCIDKCACGGSGKLHKEYYESVYYHRAGCPRCGYATEYHSAQYKAMCEWNIRQRKMKGTL